MANFKQATTPPPNLKDMKPVSSSAQGPSGIPPVALTGLGPTSVGPIPSFLGTTFDTIRQWIRPSNNPQFRIFPLPIKTNSQISSIVNSTIVNSSTPVSDVPFNKVTTGINTTLLTVGNGGTLEASGSGIIDATEINGIPITGTLTHPGMIPISQPGNTDAIWADPLVQGLYPPGTNVTTGGTGSTPINPVLIGAQNPSSLLENLQMDATKSLFVTGALTHNGAAPGASNVGALVGLANAAAPTFTEGYQTLLSVDLSGNLRTTTSFATGSRVEIWDATNTATVKAASTAAVATDTALVVTEPGSTTAGACANTSVTSVSSAALAANTARREFMIINTDVVTVYIGLGQVPTATAYHFALKPCTLAHDGTGGSFVSDVWKGAVNAIVASTSGHVAITELT